MKQDASCVPKAYQMMLPLLHRLPPIVGVRLAYMLLRPAHFNWDCEFTARIQLGSLYMGNLKDEYALWNYCLGYCIWRNWAIALATCEPGDCIIEIGANIGSETVAFADIVGRTGQVYAFEPLPSNMTRLRQNIDANKLTHVELFERALGSQSGTLEFSVPPSDDHTHGSGFLILDKRGSSETIFVKCETLDAMSPNLKPARIIFMDIEGAEIDAIRGGARYLREHHPHIVVEALQRVQGRAGHSVGELYTTISELGYRIYNVGRFKLEPLSESPLGKSKTDWFCVHERAQVEEVVSRINRTIQRTALMPLVLNLNPLQR